MKKKFLSLLVLTLSVVVGLSVLTACSGGGDNCQHEYGDWQVVKEQTCTENGLEERTCNKCGKKESKTIKADHKWDSEWTVDVEPSYQKEGEKSHHCLRCDERKDITKIDALTETKLIYEKVEGGYKVTGVAPEAENDKVMIVPDTYEGEPVIAIGDNAFFGKWQVTELYLADSIVTIGSSAFEDMQKLVKVKMPSNLSVLNNRAFEDTYKLTNLELPESLTEIGSYVFSESGINALHIPKNVSKIGNNLTSHAKSLTKLTVDENNAEYYSDGNCIITKEHKLIAGCAGSVIPNTVTVIGEQAFYFTGITKVVVPASVETIEKEAFYGCESLVEVELNGLNDANASPTGNGIGFGSRVFKNCTSLKKVTINEGVGKIGYEGFMNTAIEELVLPDSLVGIESGAFKGSLLKKIKLGRSFNPQKNYGGLNSSGLLETIDLGTNTQCVLKDGCLLWKVGVIAFINKEEITIPTSYTDPSGTTKNVTQTYQCYLSDMHQVKKVTLPAGFRLSLTTNLHGMTSLEEITFEGSISIGQNPNELPALFSTLSNLNLKKINLSKEITLGKLWNGNVLFTGSYDKVNPNLVITTPDTKEEWETKIEGAVMPTCTVVCSNGELKYKYNK